MTSKDPDMSAGEESEMSEQAKQVLDVLRGCAQTRDDDNLMHEDDFSTPPTDGKAFWRASDDLELLARLRSHEDFEAMLEELEDTATRHGSEVDGLLLQLLRGDTGQGGE